MPQGYQPGPIKKLGDEGVDLGHKRSEALLREVGLERGVRNPTLDVLVKLARALGVAPSELLATIS